MKSFVRFEEVGVGVNGRLTKIWIVKNSQSDFEIGRIHWHNPWRKYIFSPSDNCIFDTSCMREISDFIEMAMTERKSGVIVDH